MPSPRNSPRLQAKIPVEGLPVTPQVARVRDRGPGHPSFSLPRDIALEVRPEGSSPGIHAIQNDNGAGPSSAPILTASSVPPPEPAPRFAEQLTPLRLRKKPKAHRTLPPDTADIQVDGPSRSGYYVQAEGDLYRGAVVNPQAQQFANLEEDAISIVSSSGSSSPSTRSGGSSASSSSMWSWGSGGLDRSRRRTMAVLGMVGEALGVRRGSDSSSSESSKTGDETDATSQASTAGRRRRRRVRRRRSRTFSLSHKSDSDSDSSGIHTRPQKREHVPRRREFTLMFPPPSSPNAKHIEKTIAFPGSGLDSALHTPDSQIAHHGIDGGPAQSDRLLTTPSLPLIIDSIRSIRSQTGMSPPSAVPTPAATPPQTPSSEGPLRMTRQESTSLPGRRRDAAGLGMKRERSGPGTKREAMMAGAPKAPAKSRLQALRGTASSGSYYGSLPLEPANSSTPRISPPLRPKSAADLLGLPNPHGSTGSLSSLRTAHEFAMPSATATPVMSVTDLAKAKRKREKQGCWWLDVACPGWEDLRDLGELLNLHPLTLEDVLQQDPREKLDVFDKLGYYFVVFRAIDESYFKYTPGSSSTGSGLTLGLAAATAVSLAAGTMAAAPDPEQRDEPDDKKESRRRGWGIGRAVGAKAGGGKGKEKVEIVEERPGKEGLEGVGVGAVNVYLAVFQDGIISFHFDDIGKHTRRVRDKVLSLPGEGHGSDWIAHGLMDSIVDAFFPLIGYVDGEVDEIDSLVIDPTTDPRAEDSPPMPGRHQVPMTRHETQDIELSEKVPSDHGDQKEWKQPDPNLQWVSPPPPTPVAKLLTPLKRFSVSLSLHARLLFFPTGSAGSSHRGNSNSVAKAAMEPVFDRHVMLRRMTDTRKLVTGLGRLLGAKNQVVGKLRKRVAEEGGAVGAYIGDLQDHILLMQTSLNHYEYILSHCQPAYLSHLNLAFSFTRGNISRSILALSTVTISILPMQFITSSFSLNVHLPANGTREEHRNPDGTFAGFYVFGIIVTVVCLVAIAMLLLVRYWRYQASMKWSRRRGEAVPATWAGFWGRE